jgi:uncharacterized membrane protein YfcA
MAVYEIVLLIIAGLAVGFINTLAGGGSIISLSILMAMGLPAQMANGTNRIAIFLQTLVATASFKQQKVLDSKKALILGIPTVIGSILGAQIAIEINENVFEKVMAGVMLLMLFFIFYKPKQWLVGQKHLQEKKVTFWQIILFFFIGIYGGFLHVGIGYMLLASIVIGAGFDLVKANAIKVFLVLLYAPFTLIVFSLNSQVNWKYGLILAIGNIIGAFIASRLSVSKGANFVRYVILVVVILTASHIFGLFDVESIFKSLVEKFG